MTIFDVLRFPISDSLELAELEAVPIELLREWFTIDVKSIVRQKNYETTIHAATVGRYGVNMITHGQIWNYVKFELGVSSQATLAKMLKYRLEQYNP